MSEKGWDNERWWRLGRVIKTKVVAKINQGAISR
jgi:hypothetical protein